MYDVEATKTTGLVQRLIAEKDHPQADLFWNGELAQTLLLKEQGVLAPFPPSVAIPAADRDPEGYWAGFGGRARIILVNTDRLSPDRYPHTLADLAGTGYDGDEIGIAYPLFGTSATHAAALYSVLGQEEARQYYKTLEEKGVQVVDGNSVVRDLVVGGSLAAGVTDTDDACRAVEQGAPVKILVPDQGEGEAGTLIIPNTVGIIAGGPHPHEAAILADYLLSNATEVRLAASGWIQVPSRGTAAPAECIGADRIRGMNVSPDGLYRNLEPAKRDLAEIFLR